MSRPQMFRTSGISSKLLIRAHRDGFLMALSSCLLVFALAVTGAANAVLIYVLLVIGLVGIAATMLAGGELKRRVPQQIDGSPVALVVRPTFITSVSGRHALSNRLNNQALGTDLRGFFAPADASGTVCYACNSAGLADLTGAEVGALKQAAKAAMRGPSGWLTDIYVPRSRPAVNQ